MKKVKLNNFEIYNQNPSIELIKPGLCPLELADCMKKFTRSAMILLIELLLLFPDRDIFFIARDMEYYYYAAKMLFSELPEYKDKFHILNVSRDTIRSVLLKKYCEQEGVSGKKVLLVDTGFNGNIITKIKKIFSMEDIEGCLICSESPKYCSLYAVMLAYNLNYEESPVTRKRVIENMLEQLPHYTNKAHKYRLMNGKIEPVSYPADKVWKKLSLQIMSFIRLYFGQPKVRNTWSSIFIRFKSLVDYIKIHNTNRILLNLDADCLFNHEASLKTDSKRIYLNNGLNRCTIKVPFGFADFLRDIKDKTREGNFNVRFVSNSQPIEWINCLVISGKFNGHTLHYYGISIDDIKDLDSWKIINYPGSFINDIKKENNNRLDHQKCFTKVWEIVEKITMTNYIQTDELSTKISSVLNVPEGKGFIRDILEGFYQHRYRIRLKPELIGAMWNIILEKRSN